jgi:hypothetical protein
MTEHDRGYSKQRFEEYRVACAEASTRRITILPGIEYSDPDNTIHILTWGIHEFFGEGLQTMEVLSRVRDAGGVAVMAHPTRKDAWKRFDRAWTPLLSGIELWNRKSDGATPSADAKQLLNDFRLIPFAGIDFHRPRQFFPLWMRMDIADEAMGNGRIVSESTVIDAIRSHRCVSYALGLPVSAWSEGALRHLALAAECVRQGATRVLRRRRQRNRC